MNHTAYIHTNTTVVCKIHLSKIYMISNRSSLSQDGITEI